MKKILLDGSSLTVDNVYEIANGRAEVGLSEEAIAKINKSRAFVDKLVSENRVVYGITTGFGKFSDTPISPSDCEKLQENLIMSHACGVGAHLDEECVKAIMILRANALSKGYSGIRLNTVQTLIDMVNKGVIPAIPEKGSLGASGDLAPLAHMVLPLIGKGEAYYKGKLISGEQAMKEAGIKPVVLTSKEGLALINGTQVMTGVALITAYRAKILNKLSDIAAAMCMEAENGITDAFIPELHIIRPHKGQVDTAANMLKILDGSKRTTKEGDVRVQDAYVFRCVPQIHGASKDAINFVLDKIEIEINSVTDNPIILTDMGRSISGGNFHGQPMALPFDFLGIAIAELANVSERRIERLVNPALSGLVPFLAEKGGLNSGFMIVQYAAAALVSENKVLAHPASVDSIPSSANQEDHVSMGTIAARKARDIYYNASRVLALEFLTAAQAIDVNSKDKGKALGKGTDAAYKVIRAKVSKVEEDRIMYNDINAVHSLIEDESIIKAVEKATGKLNN